MICRSGSQIRSMILRVGVLGVLVEHRSEALEHLPDGLVELGLAGVAAQDLSEDRLELRLHGTPVMPVVAGLSGTPRAEYEPPILRRPAHTQVGSHIRRLHWAYGITSPVHTG